MHTLLDTEREDAVAPPFISGIRIAQQKPYEGTALDRTPKRILVVDDDPDIRQVLLDRLSSYGYVVETAINGREALDALRRGGFDGMLLDMRMPQVDGIEVLRQTRLQRPNLPVVMVSALSAQEQVARAMTQGACAYLIKPFDAALLKQVVERCFGPASEV